MVDLGLGACFLLDTLMKSSVVVAGNNSGKLVKRMRLKYLASLTEVAPILCTKMVMA